MLGEASLSQKKGRGGEGQGREERGDQTKKE